jgi:hypothetical protein
MTMRRSFAVAAALACCAGAASAEPLSSAITYQGELSQGGVPASGPHDLRFRLFDASGGGTQAGATLCADDVSIANGKFTVSLDFGPQFTGERRWLEIEVRADTGLGCADATGFLVLGPRQELTNAPHAAFALSAGDAASLGGQGASFFTDASNISSGTLPNSRLASSVVRTDVPQTFTAANTFAAGTFRIANASATFSTTLLTNASASRSLLLPDASGTLISTGNLIAITATGTVGSGIWQGTPVGVGFGGTGANLGATGGAGQFVKQPVAGGAFVVGTIGTSDLPSITLSGDVTGTTGVANVVALRGRGLSPTAPNPGEVLKWSGSTWNPSQDIDTNTTYTAGTGLTLAGTTFSANVAYFNTNFVNADESLAGDVTGVYSALSVVALRGRPIASTVPTANQVLTFNGSQWAPATLPAQNPTMGGDLSGTASSAQIVMNAVGTAEIDANAVTSVDLATDSNSLAKVSGNAMAASGSSVTFFGPVTIPSTTRTYSIPGVSFLPGDSTTGYQFLSGYRYAPEGTSAADGYFAAIHVPDGAIVSSIVGHVYDADAANTLTLQFWRVTSTGITSFVANTTSTFAGNTTLPVIVGPAIGTIDNDESAYFARVFWNELNDGVTRFRLYSVKVNYTISAPLP